MPDFQQLIHERLRNSGLSPLREAEIVDEMAQHLRDRYDALRLGGATDDHALAAVVADLDQRDLRAELRRVEQTRSDPVTLGAPSPGGWWAALRQDVRYGLRVLRLNPSFTTVCVLSLALGIGANTAIFQLIDAVRMRTLPVKDPQELFVLRPTDSGRSGNMTGRYSYVTNPMWEQVRAHQQGFNVFAFGTTAFNLAPGGEARYADGLWVSGEFFDVLGVQAVLGRVFHAADDHRGCGSPGAVISYAFWQHEFGGDPDVTGKTVSLEGHVFPVIGVTPASFYGLDVGHKFDVAVPICSEPVINGEDSLYSMPHGWWLGIMGRLIFGAENPVGRTFKVEVYKGEPMLEYQVVGLVKNTKYKNLREDFSPIAFYPQMQDGKPDPGTEVVVRSSLPLEPLLALLRRTVADFNPAVTIDFHVFDRQVKQTLLRERLLATLSGFFGALAVVLATIGVYGVIAYLVVRRTNEIGIRIALGATPARILTMVIYEAASLLAFGLAIGAVLALVSGKVAAKLLVGLKTHDAATLAAASLLLCAGAVSASLLPARRAARLEPTMALREE